MVLFGGRVCFYSGGRAWFFQFFGYNEIRSMSGRYASYWNAFLCCMAAGVFLLTGLSSAELCGATGCTGGFAIVGGPGLSAVIQ